LVARVGDEHECHGTGRGDPEAVPRYLAEAAKRGWGREVAKRLGDEEGHADEHPRIGCILDRIEKRYGTDRRNEAESSVAKGERDGAEWHEKQIARPATKFVQNLKPGGFWERN
jgi:hypothetical protein